MGFWDWLFKRRREAPDAAAVEEVADRIERFGDRFRNADDREGEQAAREAAQAARQSSNLEEALAIEHDFLQAQGLLEESAPGSVRPRVGRGSDASGSPYVLYGRKARVGGSRSWRNHNPGYIRCSDRARTYGAIGCDGEYAIFPDEETGLNALGQWLVHEYPSSTVGEALRQQFPPEEAGEDVAERIQQQMGLDPQQRIEELTEEQLQGVAEACEAQAHWIPGATYESGEATPDWMESVWAQAGGAEAGPAEEAPGRDDS